MRQIANPARWRQRGVSLFEIAVVAIIVAVLVGALLQRLISYRAQAELALVDHTVNVLRGALAVQVARLQVQGRGADMEKLAQQNPMNWLTQKPANYAGEFFAPEASDVHAGNWYFDRKTHILVYSLNYQNKFLQGTQKALKYQVKFVGLSQQIDRSSKLNAPRALALIRVDG